LAFSLKAETAVHLESSLFQCPGLRTWIWPVPAAVCCGARGIPPGSVLWAPHPETCTWGFIQRDTYLVGKNFPILLPEQN